MSAKPDNRGDTGIAADASPSPSPEARARFRHNLVKVMSMQLFALLVLWLLQARYAR